MTLICTRCRGSGFLNIHQVPTDDILDFDDDIEVLEWVNCHEGHDVQVCDCCGNGEDWYGVSGEHYNSADPPGNRGPYAYNGGLCECSATDPTE